MELGLVIFFYKDKITWPKRRKSIASSHINRTNCNTSSFSFSEKITKTGDSACFWNHFRLETKQDFPKKIHFLAYCNHQNIERSPMQYVKGSLVIYPLKMSFKLSITFKITMCSFELQFKNKDAARDRDGYFIILRC